MNGNIDESVNNVNNNFVNVVVDELFDDQAMVNTSCSVSLVDNKFCKKHNLCVNPLLSGELKSYVGIGESTTTAIGSTNIELTFVGEKFSHSFQVINNLTVNIIIGVDFLCKYKAYLSQGVFSLGVARITVPLVGRGDASGLAELREQVTLQPNTQRKIGLNCPKINRQPISLVEP